MRPLWGSLTGERGQGCSDRGQMSPIGLTLVFGFVLVGAVLIIAFGATALNGAEESLDEQRAEKALTQFDSKAALVALGNTDTQDVTFARNSDGEFVVEEGTGWMRITIDNRSDGNSEKVLLNRTMGSVVYETEGTVVAYQGGGVWRTEANSENAKTVSPPEFHFRNGTLTLPVVNVTGDSSLGSEATVTHRQTTKTFPNTTIDGNFTNPLEDHRVRVTVHSEYYRGWGSYFEERTDGQVDYDHDRNLVNLTLVTPLDKDTVSEATASLSASGDFIISGSAATACGRTRYTDSYNSSVGSYCSQTPGEEGNVVYGGNVDISKGSGGSDIKGNVVSGRTVSVGNGAGKPFVDGNVNYTVACSPSDQDCADRIVSPSGTVNQIDGVDSTPRINPVIVRQVTDIRDDNDNAGAPISSDKLDFSAAGSSDEVTLTAGQYYLERIDYGGTTDRSLEFDTSGGDITLAIEGDVEMPSEANMTVTGDNVVKVYVNGSDGASNGDDWTWDMNGKTNVTNPDDNSTQLRVYGKDDFRFRMDTSSGSGSVGEFVGVIFAPPGSSGSGEVELASGQVFGGILTGTTTIETKGAIHYDEALRNEKIIEQGANVIEVTYLHVSINEIEVTD